MNTLHKVWCHSQMKMHDMLLPKLETPWSGLIRCLDPGSWSHGLMRAIEAKSPSLNSSQSLNTCQYILAFLGIYCALSWVLASCDINIFTEWTCLDSTEITESIDAISLFSNCLFFAQKIVRNWAESESLSWQIWPLLVKMTEKIMEFSLFLISSHKGPCGTEPRQGRVPATANPSAALVSSLPAASPLRVPAARARSLAPLLHIPPAPPWARTGPWSGEVTVGLPGTLLLPVPVRRRPLWGSVSKLPCPQSACGSLCSLYSLPCSWTGLFSVQFLAAVHCPESSYLSYYLYV